MKKRRIFGMILCLILLIQWVPSAVFAQTDESVTNGCHSADAGKTLAESTQLLATSKAVVLYELETQTLIYGWNMDQMIYPSSMVKLMTALVAYEQGNLDQRVTVTSTALSAVDSDAVIAGFIAGEVLTLRDLMYSMLVGSANDASTIIAEHIGGNQENFVRLMNARAAELGCTGTHFTNAHGLHHENNVTNARDVLRITEALLKIPELREIFCTVSYTIPATNLNGERSVTTTNSMMTGKKYLDERVTGGKTGATDEAGRCLAVTAEGNGMHLVAIVMGAQPTYAEDGQIEYFGSFEEMKVLLDYAFQTYHVQQVFSTGQSIAQFAVQGGDSSVVVEPGDAVYTVLPIDLDESILNWTYHNVSGNLSAPIAKGERLSQLQVWYGSICLGVTDLLAMHSVQKHSNPIEADRIADQDDAGSWTGMLMVFVILLGVALLAVGVLVLIRVVRTYALRAMRRRRRIHRRRSR